MNANRALILAVLSTVPDGLGTRENIADVLAEKLLVIDRGDLPEVGPDPVLGREADLWAEHDDANGTWWELGATSPEFMRGRALEMLALLEHHAANPPVDEKAVDNLQDALMEAKAKADNWTLRDIARHLIADGWTKPEATR